MLLMASSFFFPKIPAGVNFQLAFPHGMRTMSKPLALPRESNMDSDEIDETSNGIMYDSILVGPGSCGVCIGA